MCATLEPDSQRKGPNRILNHEMDTLFAVDNQPDRHERQQTDVSSIPIHSAGNRRNCAQWNTHHSRYIYQHET